MKVNNIKYSTSFLNTIDRLLESSYSDINSRNDFLQVFYLLDRLMMFDKNKEYAQFDIASMRDLFKRKKGKRILSDLLFILKDKNIIDMTDFYFNLKDKSKSRTRKYKYTEYFLDQIIEDEISFKTENISRDFYERLQKEHITLKPHLLEQYNLLKSDRFKIDIIEASQWLLDNLKNKLITKNQYHIHQRVILSLDDKTGLFVVEDEKTGRVFTNFSCMKKELRKFCTIDNEHLNSYDLKSAQPYLLISELIKQYNYQDLHELYNIITNKDLYLYFISKSDKRLSRDESKIEFMRYLYKDNRGSVPFEIIIKKEFPNVYMIIRDFKNKLKKSNSNLALYLQRKESDIFVMSMCNNISKGVLTVHDSVYFKNSLEQEIKNNLKQNLNNNQYFNFTLAFS